MSPSVLTDPAYFLLIDQFLLKIKYRDNIQKGINIMIYKRNF